MGKLCLEPYIILSPLRRNKACVCPLTSCSGEKETPVFGYFSHQYNKMAKRDSLRKEGFLLAHSVSLLWQRGHGGRVDMAER